MMRIGLILVATLFLSFVAYSEDMDIKALQAKLAAQEERLKDLKEKIVNGSDWDPERDSIKCEDDPDHTDEYPQFGTVSGSYRGRSGIMINDLYLGGRRPYHVCSRCGNLVKRPLWQYRPKHVNDSSEKQTESDDSTDTVVHSEPASRSEPTGSSTELEVPNLDAMAMELDGLTAGSAGDLKIAPQPGANSDTLLPPWNDANRDDPTGNDAPPILDGPPQTGPYYGPEGGDKRDLFQRLPEDAGEIHPVQPPSGSVVPGEKESSE